MLNTEEKKRISFWVLIGYKSLAGTIFYCMVALLKEYIIVATMLNLLVGDHVLCTI